MLRNRSTWDFIIYHFIIMEDNKLIAEFMGYSPVSGVYVSRKDEFHIDEMQYDISWDWLMPVVEKCYESGAEENEVGDITHALLDCDRKETHKAVVEFIKQLNKKS
jgi:hypothetical protein|tara:strand:- start:176 stop:493 length:318 start_codon:yes stop_codon:yes gene_type:complete